MRSIALLCVCCFTTAFFGCAKEDNFSPNESLEGIWYEEELLEEYNRISRLQYHFMDSDSLVILRMEIDIDSRETLGYRYKSLVKYHLEGDQITFYNLVNYSNDDTEGAYTEIDSLKLIDYTEDPYTVTFKLEDGGNKLVLIYPPCGPAENCIGSITLIKERFWYINRH